MHVDFWETGDAKICGQTLSDLPEWFGQADAVSMYAAHAQKNPMFSVRLGEEIVGYLSVADHFSVSCEIHSMAIKRDFHRTGCGSLLVESVKEYAEVRGFKFLTVKTLSESRTDENYAATRKFYLSVGFLPLEELKGLWDETNPCLMMIQAL